MQRDVRNQNLNRLELRLKMARILIVDDQEMMRDSLAATLVREGHEVVATGDGPAAVAVAKPRPSRKVSIC